MSGSPHVLIERRGEIALIRFNRPPVNALDLATLAALTDAVEGAGKSGASALVVIGREGAFSAGIDVKTAMSYTEADLAVMETLVNRLLLALYDSPIPTVAAVSGFAIGGGLVVALACDVRLGILSERPSMLALPEVRAGVAFPEGAIAIVRAELSPAIARRLVVADLRLDPAAALAAGVLDAIHPAAELETAALAEAGRLSGLSPEAFRLARRQLRAPTLQILRGALKKGEAQGQGAGVQVHPAQEKLASAS